MKEYLAVSCSTKVNRCGTMFSVSALVSGMRGMSMTGLPYYVGHDHHRLMGWASPLAVHIQPGLGRLTMIMMTPEDSQEEQQIVQAFNRETSRHIDTAMQPARGELRARLKEFLVGDPGEIAPNCAAFLQPGLARRTFARIFDGEDKDGLVSLKDLKRVSFGVYEIDGLLLFAHPFLRRSLSRFNTLNTDFLSRLEALTARSDLKVRVALDPDMVGLAKTHHLYEEAQYWFGPHFLDDISNIPLGLTRHEASEEQKFFAGVSRAEFWWYEQKENKTFECEELQDIPSHGSGKDKFGCRFVHSIASPDHRTFQHTDGAIRLYDETAMVRRLGMDLKTAGRKTEYTKLWRVDGAIPITTWKRLISDYYRDNTLIGEYLGGKDPVLEECRQTKTCEIPNDSILNYIPGGMSEKDGINLSISYHPRRKECKSGRIIVSYDNFRNASICYHYIEADTLEVIKALKQKGFDVEIEAGLFLARFEDDILNLPIFAHTGNLAVKDANSTISVIAELLDALAKRKQDKLVTLSIEVNYNEHAVIFSFAGRVQNLLRWFGLPEAKLPQDIEDLPDWTSRAMSEISQSFPCLKEVDNLWSTLKTSGVIKFDRKFISPETIQFRPDDNGVNVRIEIPKDDIPVFDQEGIGIGRIFIIEESLCTKCSLPYRDCLHSKYLDEGVVHEITAVKLLGIFWSAAPQRVPHKIPNEDYQLQNAVALPKAVLLR